MDELATDRVTFNYGRALGRPRGVESYRVAVDMELDLRRISGEISSIQWAMAMAIRNVQHAETPAEQAEALLALAETKRACDVRLLDLPGRHVRLYRYARGFGTWFRDRAAHVFG